MADINTAASDKQPYVFRKFKMEALNTPFILNHCSEQVNSDQRGFFDIHPIHITINEAAFSRFSDSPSRLEVGISLAEDTLAVSCRCTAPGSALCRHQAQALFNLMQRTELRVFFDKQLRRTIMLQEAVKYGLENEPDLDAHFEIRLQDGNLQVSPFKKELFPVEKFGAEVLDTAPTTVHDAIPAMLFSQKENAKVVLVVGKHRFYKHLVVTLFETAIAKNGKIKNPLKAIKPLDFIWKTNDNEVLKFLTAIARFQNSYDNESAVADIEALKAMVRNPLHLDTFFHDPALSENITATSVVPVVLSHFSIDLRLTVHAKDDFYEVNAHVLANDTLYPLDKLELKFQYFLVMKQGLQLIGNYDFLRMIEFFKNYSNKLLLHRTKFEEFRRNFLSKLEHKVHINYAYLKPATKEQLQETALDRIVERKLYLSDSEDYILITPVIKYGTMEIPVLSKKQLYAIDIKGEPFSVPRNEIAELAFIDQLMKQHSDFEEQLSERPEREYFYLHKFRFLDEEWFLNAFDAWKSGNITVLGFKDVSRRNFNPHKAKISVQVNSGIDWFDASVSVTIGNQKLALKHIQKAARNNSRYIPLDDGSTGILPQHWLEKFIRYFNAGEIAEEKLRIPKIKFAELEELFEEDILSNEVRNELALYKSKVANFKAIEQVWVPGQLKATLRDYQKEGLNWLNFLDEFNFGGCLADDMGLGKTIQIIAFILSQRRKRKNNTNLIVVPTSLVFNWQAEVKKFAPSIKILTLHGANRVNDISAFKNYEIVLTTYGTLLSDVLYLKKFTFNYIILDESQAIKNPESQRYKAARLLKSRNRLVLTGTPIENNTYDIYGQFSFACPGLLGSKRYFKQHFSDPIDKFKNKKRGRELQQQINPFILRRTKEQVAQELPDKTEMVIYCEMGLEQRRVYDAYARQFRDFLQQKIDDEVLKHTLHVLQGLTKLRQICNSPALLADEASYGAKAAKIEVLMEQIEAKAPHHKILVFSQFVSMLELIKKALEERNVLYQYLTGQTKDRAEVVEKFQNNEQSRVFLISLKAGGTGLNLTEADYVYLVDPWWNPAVENQAIDRSHRIGQNKNVVAVRLICPDTIEEKMMQLQESKKLLANDIVQADKTILKSLTKKELLELF